MPTYNYKAKELIAKIVYYGPGRCGKTTNLQQIHAKMRPETRSELLSVATETDRTIYFDLLPLNLGTINGMKFMVRLFTVPGQIYYAETRKLVLRGTDGVVFVADSQDHMMDENRESLRDLKVNLEANGIDYANIPLVLQYNKRDLPRLISEAELDATLNDRASKSVPAIATNGDGVLETLRLITVGVFNAIKASAGATALPPTGVPAPAAATKRPASTAKVDPFPSNLGAAPPVAPFSPGPPLGVPGPMPSPIAPVAPMQAAPEPFAAPRAASRSAALDAALQAAKSAGRAALGAPGTALPPIPPIPAGGLPPLPSPGALPPIPAPMSSGTGTGNAPKWTPPKNGPDRPERPPPPPATLGADLLLDEFKNLAVVQAQLAERMAVVEQELKRLSRENQEMRETLTRDHGSR
ncbi:MAG: ADP-ribosylation factor-like protein [Myxococcota bacterium]